MAQSRGVPSPKAGTRLITLGKALDLDATGPGAVVDLITVEGTHYVVDAGDGAARRLAEAGIDLGGIGMILLRTIMTITRRALAR